MQGASEECGFVFVAGKPVAVQDEVVELVWEDEFIDGNAASAQGIGEAGGLLVGDLRIVIAVDEQDGRAPAR